MDIQDRGRVLKLVKGGTEEIKAMLNVFMDYECDFLCEDSLTKYKAVLH